MGQPPAAFLPSQEDSPTTKLVDEVPLHTTGAMSTGAQLSGVLDTSADLPKAADKNLLAISAKFLLASLDTHDHMGLPPVVAGEMSDDAIQHQLQNFQFGTKPTESTDFSTQDQTQETHEEKRNEDLSGVLLRVKPLDVFFVEFFMFNYGSHTSQASFILRPLTDAEGWTLATPLDAALGFG